MLSIYFANDIALYKETVSSHDKLLLWEDLPSIYEWCRLWQLDHWKVNTFIFPILSIFCLVKTIYPGLIVYSSKALEIHIKWGVHVKHLVANATHSLNYLWHTLFSCPAYVAYKSLVKPTLNICLTLWCLHTLKNI